LRPTKRDHIEKWQIGRESGGAYLNVLSVVLVGLGLWLIVDGVLSIVKYSEQTLPEQLIRVIRAIVGVIIVVIGIVGN
jgi:small neutral amino acid transporter SnatA (MarC family)